MINILQLIIIYHPYKCDHYLINESNFSTNHNLSVIGHHLIRKKKNQHEIENYIMSNYEEINGHHYDASKSDFFFFLLMNTLLDRTCIKLVYDGVTYCPYFCYNEHK